VARIDIKEGQEVKAGQALFELDSQIAANEVARLLQEGVGYQTQIIQTQALIDKTRLEAQTIAQSSKAEAQATEIAIAQARAKAQAQEATISESQKKAAATRELLTQFQQDVTAHNARLSKLEPLVAQGVLGTEQLFQAQEALRERQRSITQSMGELQQTLAQLDRLQAERKQVLDEPNRLQAERDQQAAQGRKAVMEAEQKIQQLRVEKTQLQAKLNENEKLVNKAKAELKQLSLTAPVDGVVSSLNMRNTGEVVKEGQTIAEIAPGNAPLVLSATLPNRDAGFVQTGMSVQLKFDAYPYQDYGIVPGKVISVSPDAKPDEKLGPVYRVEVALERHYVTANHKTIEFKAGQTANADIIIRRRRIADILLDPIRQLQKGGMSL
jgi:HlyD family secretion protein